MISSDRKTKPSGKEYVYLKCSHFKGNCKNPQVNENVVLQQIEDELKNLSAPVRRKMDLHNWDSGINRDFGGHIGIRYL